MNVAKIVTKIGWTKQCIERLAMIAYVHDFTESEHRAIDDAIECMNDYAKELESKIQVAEE